MLAIVRKYRARRWRRFVVILALSALPGCSALRQDAAGFQEAWNDVTHLASPSGDGAWSSKGREINQKLSREIR